MTAEEMAEPWREDAACIGKPPEWFFPELGEDTIAAKAVCALCPVQQDCLAYALRNNEQYGIWGGKSERQRKRIRRHMPTGRVNEQAVAAQRLASNGTPPPIHC